MDNIETAALTVVPPRNSGHRFKKGHQKYGGRKKRDTSVLPSAIATCIRLALDPVEVMARIVITGTLMDPDGREHTVDTRTRIKVLLRLSEHVSARLSANTVTGSVEHHHAHAHADLTHIMRDPQLADAAERLALALCGYTDDEMGPPLVTEYSSGKQY